MENRSTSSQSRTEWFPSADGHRLALEHFGEPSDPGLIYAHGFGQNRQAWAQAAAHLAQGGWYGRALDARGHGDSQWSIDGHYSIEQFVADLLAVAGSGPAKPVLVGASMGGLLGLLAEGESEQGVFSAIVLVDVTPRWESAGVDRILDFMGAHPQGFVSLEAAQAAIETYLPHRERKDPQRLAKQLRQGEDGRWRWHWDPRLLDAVGRNGEQYIPRLLAASRRVQVPVLLLSGGRSDVVSSSTIAEFQSLVPHASHIQIPAATHLVVGDRNDEFTAEIAAFLAREFPATHQVARGGRFPAARSAVHTLP